MSGASTSPNPHAFAYAAASVKKMLEVSKLLGAENFVFWGGREGYNDLLNTDVKRVRTFTDFKPFSFSIFSY